MSTPELAARRAAYVEWIATEFGAMDMTPTDGRQWALAHARLLLGRETAAANGYLAALELTRDADICFIRFLKTLLDFEGTGMLESAARDRLVGVLREWPRNDKTTVARWPVIHTENHDLMQLTIGMFAQQYRGESVADHVREIAQALRWRFERGWIEWNSVCYQVHYSNPLLVLVDHAPDAGLRRLAGDLMNVLLAERAVLGIGGYLGGPSFRCRTADANHSLTARPVAYLVDGRYDGFVPTMWLAFGLGEPRFDFATSRVPGLEPASVHYASANEPRLKQDEGMFFATSSFVPHPVVAALATEKRPELVYTGQRFAGWPGEEIGETHWRTQRWMPAALTYYNTPHVSLGSVHSDGWVCQSRYNKVLFAADPSCGLRLEQVQAGVPPHKRRYEVHGRCVQHRECLAGQGTLFADGGVTPTRVGQWDVYRVGRGLAAAVALPDSWYVLHVADLDMDKDVATFVRALSVPEVVDGCIRTAALNGDRIAIDMETVGITVNGIASVHPPAMLHDCSAMRSVYGSGRLELTGSAGSVVFPGD